MGIHLATLASHVRLACHHLGLSVLELVPLYVVPEGSQQENHNFGVRPKKDTRYKLDDWTESTLVRFFVRCEPTAKNGCTLVNGRIPGCGQVNGAVNKRVVQSSSMRHHTGLDLHSKGPHNF